MSREILDAVRQIEREKGIEDDVLVRALEDALLAAYKKTPGAARHATVELDSGGDFLGWPATVSVPGSPGFGGCSSASSGRSCVDSLTVISLIAGIGGATQPSRQSRAVDVWHPN